MSLILDTSTDLSQYRKISDTDEQWDLKKSFMLAHRRHCSLKRLLCLTEIFSNIIYLECTYPAPIMTLVEKMSRAVFTNNQHVKEQNKLFRVLVDVLRSREQKSMYESSKECGVSSDRSNESTAFDYGGSQQRRDTKEYSRPFEELKSKCSSWEEDSDTEDNDKYSMSRKREMQFMEDIAPHQDSPPSKEIFNEDVAPPEDFPTAEENSQTSVLDTALLAVYGETLDYDDVEDDFTSNLKINSTSLLAKDSVSVKDSSYREKQSSVSYYNQKRSGDIYDEKYYTKRMQNRDKTPEKRGHSVSTVNKSSFQEFDSRTSVSSQDSQRSKFRISNFDNRKFSEDLENTLRLVNRYISLSATANNTSLDTLNMFGSSSDRGSSSTKDNEWTMNSNCDVSNTDKQKSLENRVNKSGDHDRGTSSWLHGRDSEEILNRKEANEITSQRQDRDFSKLRRCNRLSESPEPDYDRNRSKNKFEEDNYSNRSRMLGDTHESSASKYDKSKSIKSYDEEYREHNSPLTEYDVGYNSDRERRKYSGIYTGSGSENEIYSRRRRLDYDTSLHHYECTQKRNEESVSPSKYPTNQDFIDKVSSPTRKCYSLGTIMDSTDIACDTKTYNRGLSQDPAMDTFSSTMASYAASNDVQKRGWTGTSTGLTQSQSNVYDYQLSNNQSTNETNMSSQSVNLTVKPRNTNLMVCDGSEQKTKVYFPGETAFSTSASARPVFGTNQAFPGNSIKTLCSVSSQVNKNITSSQAAPVKPPLPPNSTCKIDRKLSNVISDKLSDPLPDVQKISGQASAVTASISSNTPSISSKTPLITSKAPSISSNAPISSNTQSSSSKKPPASSLISSNVQKKNITDTICQGNTSTFSEQDCSSALAQLATKISSGIVNVSTFPLVLSMIAKSNQINSAPASQSQTKVTSGQAALDFVTQMQMIMSSGKCMSSLNLGEEEMSSSDHNDSKSDCIITLDDDSSGVEILKPTQEQMTQKKPTISVPPYTSKRKLADSLGKAPDCFITLDDECSTVKKHKPTKSDKRENWKSGLPYESVKFYIESKTIRWQKSLEETTLEDIRQRTGPLNSVAIVCLKGEHEAKTLRRLNSLMSDIKLKVACKYLNAKNVKQFQWMCRIEAHYTKTNVTKVICEAQAPSKSQAVKAVSSRVLWYLQHIYFTFYITHQPHPEESDIRADDFALTRFCQNGLKSTQAMNSCSQVTFTTSDDLETYSNTIRAFANENPVSCESQRFLHFPPNISDDTTYHLIKLASLLGLQARWKLDEESGLVIYRLTTDTYWNFIKDLLDNRNSQQYYRYDIKRPGETTTKYAHDYALFIK